MNVHEKVIIFGRNALGLQLEKDGLCRGITMAFIESMISKEKELFLFFLEKISGDYKLAEKIRKAELNLKLGKSLTVIERNYLEILPFYNSIVLYQSPENYYSLFNRYIKQNQIFQISKLASFLKNEKYNGLHAYNLSIGAYTKNELFNLLYELKEFLLNLNTEKNSDKVYPILVSSLNHATALTSQPQEKTWNFFDINYGNVQLFDLDEINKIKTQIYFSYQDELTENRIMLNLNLILPKKTELDLIFKFQETQFYLLKKNFSNLSTNIKIALACLSIRNKDIKIIKITLDSLPDSLKERTIELFVYKSIIASATNIIKFLFQCYPALSHNVTFIFSAIKIKNEKAVKCLIENGLNVNIKDEFGNTPLIMAAQDGNTSLVKMLLKYGAEINESTYNGLTPIHAAIISNEYSAVDFLLARRCNTSLIWLENYNIVLSKLKNCSEEIRNKIFEVVEKEKPSNLPEILALCPFNLALLCENKKIINIVKFYQKESSNHFFSPIKNEGSVENLVLSQKLLNT